LEGIIKGAGGGGGGGMDDIFSMFMGGGRPGGGGPARKAKVKPLAKQVDVTLADIYNGKTLEVIVDRHRLCEACDGIGGTDKSAVQTCGPCKGQGVRTILRQMGPGMYTQSRGPCDECGGQGETFDMTKRCKKCKGKKVQKTLKKLEVELDKGSPNGAQFTIHGEGDQVPDVEAGDVVVVVRIKPHKTFQRKGADLLIEKEITLLEALTGVDFVLTHLDGREVRIKNKPGEVIKPNSMLTCEGLGMPFHKTPYEFGNLFIKFKIVFPANVDTVQCDQIKKVLTDQSKSKTEQAEIDGASETVTLTKFEEKHKNTHAQGGTHGDDDDEEGDEAGQGVGCQA